MVFYVCISFNEVLVVHLPLKLGDSKFFEALCSDLKLNSFPRQQRILLNQRTTESSKSATPSESASPINGQVNIVTNLAAMLQEAGLGCEDVDLQKTPILYDGARIDCTISGEEVRIEAYPEDQFLEMASYVADLGFSETPVLTDGKAWTVTGSEDVLAKLKTALGGEVKAFGAIE